MEYSNHQLITHYLENPSDENFEKIIKEFSPMVYSVCYRVLNRGDLAEEASQATFLSLIEKKDKLIGGPSMIGWLHRVAYLSSLWLRKQENIRKKREKKIQLPPSYPFPEQEMEESEIQTFIDEAIQSLPGKLKDPLLMKFYENKTYNEIGLAFKTTEESVRKRVNRGLEKMKVFLKKRNINVTSTFIGSFLTTELIGTNASAATLPANCVAPIITGKSVSSFSSIKIFKGVEQMIFLKRLKATAMVLSASVFIGLLFSLPLQADQKNPATMKPGTWLEIPNSEMSQVYPDLRAKHKSVSSTIRPKDANIAWGGGVLDSKRNRMILWGGGYADYAGNELYAFDINSMKWSRITEPYPNPIADVEVNKDGTPNSRHTYGGIGYIAHVDSFFGIGGSLYGSGFGKCDKTWIFDFESKKWTDKNPTGSVLTGVPLLSGISCAYDPETKLLWLNDRDRFLYSYDIDKNNWAKAPVYRRGDNIRVSQCAMDTKRGILWGLASTGMKNTLYAYHVREKIVTQEVFIIDNKDAPLTAAIGMEYDPVSDKLVFWGGSFSWDNNPYIDTAVYVMDIETKTWTKIDAEGVPARNRNGTYGRWRYVPSVNAFIAISDGSKNVHFFKLTEGTGKKEIK